jgi:hypothetical protein
VSEQWLSTGEFAEAANLSRQAAHKALKRALDGHCWNGILLKVRLLQRRGRCAVATYEVALSSIPEVYYKGLRGPEEHTALVVSEVAPERRVPAANQGDRIAKRLKIIEQAALLPLRSPERAAALRKAADASGQSLRTLQRWLRELEERGGDVNALARRRPADAGKRRVLVSREFDKAFRTAGYSEEVLAELGEDVDQFSRTTWASPRQRSGWRLVRRDILTCLKVECRDRGIRLPDSAFRLSRRRVTEAVHFRRVDIYQNDRKRFDDQKPRVRRDNSKLAPMQQMVCDVKPIDIILRRPDGSEVWPKMIGFMDAGTHRIFVYFVALPKGQGVRQEHVTEAFLEMVAHPEWGFPQQLYRDNGTEFYHFDKIRTGLELIQTPGQPTIINARPYSAASKQIESKFAVLDRYVFNQFPGWAGGNRMNKKTQTVGKPPKPFPGSFEQFVAEAKKRIVDFETIELLDGPFAGRSPAQIYADHVAAGWRPISVHADALDAAFCERETRRVDRGTVSIRGTRYRHPELASLNGRNVEIALSWRRGSLPLFKLPELGWAYLEPEMLHLPGDIAGAMESSRLQSREVQAIRELRRLAAPKRAIDPLDERVAALPTRAAPAPIIDILMSSEAESLAEARQAGARRMLQIPSIADRQRARRNAETEELEAYLARKRS